MTVLLAAWAYRRAIIIAALVVCVPVGYYLGRHRGAAKQARVDEARATAAVAAADARYRAQEAAHAKQVDEIRLSYARASAEAKAVDAAVARDLGAGTQRMRLPVARCRPVAAQAGATPARADGAGDAELSPATATALYAIAADGDRYARQVLALQAWARSAVMLCNGGAR